MYRILIPIFLFTLSVVTNMPLFASSNEYLVHNFGIIEPNFTNISYIKTDLNIDSSGLAHAQTTVIARNIDKIIINMSLQSYENGSWRVVKSWSQTSFNTECVMYNTIYVSRGYNYRVLANVFVYQSSSLLENSMCFSSIVTF